MKIITDITEPSEYFSFDEYDEAEQIGSDLWEICESEGLKMLSAPQIGVNRAVFFINVSAPYIVVNPGYGAISEDFIEYKGSDGIKTLRHAWIEASWFEGYDHYHHNPIRLGACHEDVGRRKGKKKLENCLFQCGYDYVSGYVPAEREISLMKKLYSL